MAISNTFPGVYVQVIDQSFSPSTISRFRAGIVGVATRGPFDTPVPVANIREFQLIFGGSVPPQDGQIPEGGYGSQAIEALDDYSDTSLFVRVGNKYNVAVAGASGQVNTNLVTVSSTDLINVNDYVQLTESGTFSTINAKVVAKTPTTIKLQDNLKQGYSHATVGVSHSANAAAAAEAFVDSPVYAPPTSAFQVTGDKNTFVINTPAPKATVDAGLGTYPAFVRIYETGKVSTEMVLVKSVVSSGTGSTIFLQDTAVSQYGYSPVPLQDSYTAASVDLATKNSDGTLKTVHALQLRAATTGTWANSNGINSGLMAQIKSGSTAGTFKLIMFLDSGVVEVLDNLTLDTIEDQVNGKSSTVMADSLTSMVGPAWTLNGWNNTTGVINNVSFLSGDNGGSPSDSDIIGGLDSAGNYAGLRSFRNDDSLAINIIAIPGATSAAVQQEMNVTAQAINSLAILDVPAYVKPRDSADWSNDLGIYAGGNQRIDSPYSALYFNWFNMLDAFTGTIVQVPPTIGVLRAVSRTFQQAKPWFAAAGESRGYIDIATDLEWPAIPQEVKTAVYGGGNAVNLILTIGGRIQVYGNRTLQRVESKLAAVNVMILVNYIVVNLAVIGRKYVFDPNDTVLLGQIQQAFDAFMATVKRERGVEDYLVVVDASNNSAETRNNREVIANVAIVPTGAVERILINLTVNSSGTVLNSAT